MKHILKTRLIPILLYKDGFIVKSRQFKMFQTVGNPFSQVARYSKWNLDELIYLNISSDKTFFQNSDQQTTSSTSSIHYFNWCLQLLQPLPTTSSTGTYNFFN